jgi:hypothetical protein
MESKHVYAIVHPTHIFFDKYNNNDNNNILKDFNLPLCKV